MARALLVAFVLGWSALGYAARQPNIVFFLLDDQDYLLGGLTPLNRSFAKYMRSGGKEITNWFTHTPVCCPSRAEIITGRYFHNLAYKSTNRWDTDAAGHPRQCMHINETRMDPGPTFVSHMSNAGYDVGFFGKYLNLSPRQAPTGAHTYFVNPGPQARSARDPSGEYYPSFWYRVTPTFNGTWQNTEMQYETDIISNFSTSWLRDRHAENASKPFFAFLAPHAPHGATIPAPEYNNTFPDVTFPRTPSYNYSGLDHHWLVRQQPPITPSDETLYRTKFRERWQCLLSVDDLVGRVMETLEDIGELDNTYIFFTSDHGYHFGQLRLGQGKWNVYETDIRVPMFVRGPGIAQGTTSSLVGSHVDLAPTWLALAGVVKGPEMDGRSVAPRLLDTQPTHMTQHKTTPPTAASAASSLRSEQTVYVEYHGLGPVGAPRRLMDAFNNTYRALRFVGDDVYGDTLYAEWGGDFHFQSIVFREVFNLTADPWQLHNVVNETSPTWLAAWSTQMAAMYACGGDACLSACGCKGFSDVDVDGRCRCS